MSIYQRVDDYLFKPDQSDDSSSEQLPVRVARGATRTLWLIFTCSWTVVLIPIIPLAIVAGQCDWNDEAKFALNYLALLPLVGIFRYGSEILSIDAPPPCRKLWDVAVGAFTLDLEVCCSASAGASNADIFRRWPSSHSVGAM